MVRRGTGRPVSEADLAAFRAEVAEEYRPGAEAAIEQVEAKHPYVFPQSPDPTDDYYVLVGVTWARLRDFDPVPDATRTPPTCSPAGRGRPGASGSDTASPP